MQTHKLNCTPSYRSKQMLTILAVLEAYAYINTLNKDVAKALAIRRLTRFHKCRPKALPTH